MTDSNIVSPQKVRFFLSGLTSVPSKRLIFKPRKDRDYEQDLADLGLNKESAKQIVYSLALANYVSGPDMEHQYHENDVWIFGYDIAGVEAYIKIRTLTKLPNQPPRGLILSFHKAEFAITYVY